MDLIKHINQDSTVDLINWVQQTGLPITKERTRTAVATAILEKFEKCGNLLLLRITSKTHKRENFDKFVNADLPVEKLTRTERSVLDLRVDLGAGARRKRQEARAGRRKKKKMMMMKAKRKKVKMKKTRKKSGKILLKMIIFTPHKTLLRDTRNSKSNLGKPRDSQARKYSNKTIRGSNEGQTNQGNWERTRVGF